jgi:hypothetical protein
VQASLHRHFRQRQLACSELGSGAAGCRPAQGPVLTSMVGRAPIMGILMYSKVLSASL